MTERKQWDLQEVVKLTTREALTGIGFDMRDPTAIQADIQHLRRSREICEQIQDNAISYVTRAVVVGVIVMVAAYFGFSELAAAIK